MGRAEPSASDCVGVLNAHVAMCVTSRMAGGKPTGEGKSSRLLREIPLLSSELDTTTPRNSPFPRYVLKHVINHITRYNELALSYQSAMYLSVVLLTTLSLCMHSRKERVRACQELV